MAGTRTYWPTLTLSGALAICNGLAWIALILFFRHTRFSPDQPQDLIYLIARILGFPLASWSGVIDVVRQGRFIGRNGMALTAVVLGINALVWGFGMAWIIRILTKARRRILP